MNVPTADAYSPLFLLRPDAFSTAPLALGRLPDTTRARGPAVPSGHGRVPPGRAAPPESDWTRTSPLLRYWRPRSHKLAQPSRCSFKLPTTGKYKDN